MLTSVLLCLLGDLLLKNFFVLSLVDDKRFHFFEI